MDNRNQGVFYTTNRRNGSWYIFPKAKLELQSFIREKMRERGLEDSLFDISVEVPMPSWHIDGVTVFVQLINKSETANYSRALLSYLESELEAKFPYDTFVSLML